MGKIEIPKEFYNKPLNAKFALVHLEDRNGEAQVVFANSSRLRMLDDKEPKRHGVRVYCMQKFSGISARHSKKLKMFTFNVVDYNIEEPDKSVFNSMYDFEVLKFLSSYEPKPKRSETQRADESSDQLENSGI